MRYYKWLQCNLISQRLWILPVWMRQLWIMVLQCVGTGALSVPVTRCYPEHINWHETHRPHLTHHQQPPISLWGHWNLWNLNPSKFPRQTIINNWIPEEMAPSINIHYCAGYVRVRPSTHCDWSWKEHNYHQGKTTACFVLSTSS